jgi:competence protein ComEA
VAALSLVALAVVVLTSWLLLRGTPRPAEVEARPVQRTLPAGAPSPSPIKVVLVDVAGKVRRPGVVRLPIGSRVADALKAAGGVLPGVDIGLLNLARQLADGEQVVVGRNAVSGGPPAADGAAGIGSPTGGPVDLNAATVADLDVLPGVGPVLAQRIVDWREAHGPFTSVDQLREVSGIGDRRFTDLKPRVRV